MIAFVDVLLRSHHCKVNTLFANSYLSQLVWTQKKGFDSEKIVSKEIFLTPSVLSAGSIATTIDFLATLAFFYFSCQGHRTIGTEAPDLQKSKIKNASPILSETMDGKR